MKIDCNNSDSDADVKSIKFELYLGFRQWHMHELIHDRVAMIYQKRFEKDYIDIKAHASKELNLIVAIPNDLPFRPIDVCPRWEVKEFFDENDRLISQLMPPSYKSRSFEIFYFAKVRVAHDGMFGEPAYCEPLMIRLDQCVEQRIHVKKIEDDFDTIEYQKDPVELPPQDKQG
jgi:hypothetical protein